MKILADLHHEDLYHSLALLFEDRLGWQLYRPIGLDWFHEGFWHVYPHLDTAKQYLDFGSAVEPRTSEGKTLSEEFGTDGWKNRNLVETGEPGTKLVKGYHHGGRLYRAITLDRAKTFGFDIILSSILEHFHRYERFRTQYYPAAKHIFQMGNVGWNAPPEAKNVLNSTSWQPGQGVNHVRYHQEFSLQEFKAAMPEPHRIRAMCNLMHYQKDHYPAYFAALAGILKDRGWDVKDYGAGNDDGSHPDPAKALRDFGFLWHCKRGGDGFGYNLFTASACGRPMVVNSTQYRGLSAEPLFHDCQTTIDMSRRSPKQTADILDGMSGNYLHHHGLVKTKFKSVVDFDREFEDIKAFLGSLQ